MALKVLLSGDDATDTALDAIVADYPKTALVGLRSDRDTIARTANSYPGTPNATIKLEPCAGTHVHFKVGLKANVTGTAYVKLAIQSGANPEDQLMELSTASTTTVTLKGTAAATALANNGDLHGATCVLNIYIKNSGVNTTTLEGFVVICGTSSADGDYMG